MQDVLFFRFSFHSFVLAFVPPLSSCNVFKAHMAVSSLSSVNILVYCCYYYFHFYLYFYYYHYYTYYYFLL